MESLYCWNKMRFLCALLSAAVKFNLSCTDWECSWQTALFDIVLFVDSPVYLVYVSNRSYYRISYSDKCKQECAVVSMIIYSNSEHSNNNNHTDMCMLTTIIALSLILIILVTRWWTMGNPGHFGIHSVTCSWVWFVARQMHFPPSVPFFSIYSSLMDNRGKTILNKIQNTI